MGGGWGVIFGEEDFDERATIPSLLELDCWGCEGGSVALVEVAVGLCIV